MRLDAGKPRGREANLGHHVLHRARPTERFVDLPVLLLAFGRAVSDIKALPALMRGHNTALSTPALATLHDRLEMPKPRYVGVGGGDNDEVK